MKKKIVAVMMCAAMVAMLGAGCGSKSSDDSSSKSETKKTLTEDDIKDSMKGVKLKVGTSGLFGPFSTDERKEVMNFTDVYCDSGQVVMVNKTNDEGIKSVDDLKGKKVAVEKGTASHTYASKNLSDSELEVHDTITTAYESLEQKKVDAVIQDGPGASFYIKTTPDSNLEVVGDEFNQGQAPYCVAVSKECKYYDEINAAVKVLIKNGTTDELYAKWCE